MMKPIGRALVPVLPCKDDVLIIEDLLSLDR